jgi:hypothetical protein
MQELRQHKERGITVLLNFVLFVCVDYYYNGDLRERYSAYIEQVILIRVLRIPYVC